MKRPLSITILACTYIVMGAVGFAYHFPELRIQQSIQYDAVWVEIIRLVAIVCGIFMLRGDDWARWTALAWMAFHVIVSAFHTLAQLVVHIVFCAVIGWVLFRPVATLYFRGSKSVAHGNF